MIAISVDGWDAAARILQYLTWATLFYVCLKCYSRQIADV